MKNRPIHHYRRPPTRRRHRHCHCPRGQSPILGTFHTPLTRWGFTLLALIAFAGELPIPFLATTTAAVLAWRHR